MKFAGSVVEETGDELFARLAADVEERDRGRSAECAVQRSVSSVATAPLRGRI